jgi:hypothetical protein
MFEKLKGVTRSVRNLPDPAVDPNALPPEPAGDDDLTCPSCGASLSLKAVAKPSAAPPQADTDIPAAPPSASNTGPGF